ncbi:MAG TPA: PhnD/SsuA/transferrin family substrate-binding protein, partial [Gammaproteobacteria bacterium]
MSRRLPLACLLLALCASALPARADHQSVHVGVLLEGSAPSLLDAWQPLRAALNARVRGHEFELVPLAFDTIQQVVERGEVDFVIVDPAVYATLELRDDVSRIATRLQRENGRDLSRLATLLFTRNDRVDLSRAQDLVEARLAAVHPDSFAGWHLATYTLAGHGADPKGLLESAAFTNFDFAAVAQLVAEGRADAGVLPSGVFEQLVERGVIDPARFKTLGQREIPHFPYRHSSALFPEWAFARLRHTPDDLARQVAVALLDDGIYSASAAGWTTPLDYHSVHEVLMEISAGPYQGGLARMTLERLVDQHQRWFALAMGLLVLIVLATGFTWRLNRRLKHSQARLQKENEERRAAEETLARYGDELEERIRKRTAELEYLAHYDDL